MSTISRIPIPEPNTVNTSDIEATSPIIIPPAIVTEGIYLLSNVSTDPSDRLKPGTWTSASNRFFAALPADNPPSSTHNLQKMVTIVVRKSTYTTALTGSCIATSRLRGAVIKKSNPPVGDCGLLGSNC